MDNQPGYRYPSIEMRQSPNRGIWIVAGLLVLFLVSVLAFAGNSKNNSSTQIIPSSQPSVAQSASPSAIPNNNLTLGKRTKTTGCTSANGLPDKECTPGDIDPKVTQDNIKQTICVSGYTKIVRPPVSYTEPLKLKIMQEYGDSDSPKNYEFDHLIPLEVGGNPTSEANLWPEPYNVQYNAKEKDKVENYLHEQVCSGKITLQQAQLQVASDWKEVYKQLSR